MDVSFSHVALLVLSVEVSAAILEKQNIKAGEPEIFDSEGTKEIYVGSYETQSGLLLLVEAYSDGPYKTALSKRGPGLHHIALEVLDIEKFLRAAESIGWKMHPISEQTMEYKTAWLYSRGVPTLIEVQQKKNLSSKPHKVSKIELPVTSEQFDLLNGIGLGDLIKIGKKLSLTVDGHEVSFVQLACLN